VPTPHSEHAIKDFDLWNTTFQRFSEHRQQAGVLQHRILRPVDDPRYVVIDVDFETITKAEAFSTSSGRGSGPPARMPPPSSEHRTQRSSTTESR
jgi:hypothetical protein